MRAIFISYRRDDTEGYAGRLFQDLCERFGKDSVFMDVAGIEPGRDFRRVIEQQVASCGVLLAVIGKAWLTVADAQGRRRLDDPVDFVRLETASALKRDIPVIPVLVQQAEMPRAEQMPDDLKDLAFRNAVELTHARWDSDVELLIAALQRYVDAVPAEGEAAARAPTGTAPGRAEAAPAGRRQGWVIGPLATLALGGIAYVAWDRFGGDPEPARDAASADTRPTGADSAAPSIVAAKPPATEASSAPPAVSLAASAPAPLVAPASAPLVAPSPAPPVAAASATPLERPATPAVAATPAPVAAPKPAARPQPAKTPAPAPVIARAPAAPPAPPPASTTIARAPAPSSPPSMSSPPPAMEPAPRTTTTTAVAPPMPAPAAAPAPEAARQDPSTELFGGPGSPSMVTRTIVIKPDTKYVNVTGGEVIRFEVDGRSFIWNFNGPRSSFDLSRVAPPSMLDRKVTAYVAPNPIYRRR